MIGIKSLGRRVAVTLGLFGVVAVMATFAGEDRGYRSISAVDASAVTGGQTGCTNFTANPVLCVGGKCSPCPSLTTWTGGGNVSLKNVTTGPVTCFNCGAVCNTPQCSSAAFCMAPGRTTYDLADVAVHNHDVEGL